MIQTMFGQFFFLPKNYIVDSMQVLRNTQIPQTTNSYGNSLLEIFEMDHRD